MQIDIVTFIAVTFQFTKLLFFLHKNTCINNNKKAYTLSRYSGISILIYLIFSFKV